MRDVAEGAIAAVEHGRAGERYILANERSSSLGEMLQVLSPGARKPLPAPRWLLLALAWLQERVARLTARPARLLLSQVRMFHGVRQEYSIAKARRELGFNPRSPQAALKSAFAYLETRS